MAFHTPGGGEVQLKSYQKYLPKLGVSVELFDLWNPRFHEFDLVHFFSCISGSQHFCAYVKSLDIPLLISPNLWITEKTKHLYPIEEIRNQLLTADLIVTNSNMEGDKLAQIFNIPRELFATVYNGVDEDFYSYVAPDLFRKYFAINGPFVLNVGNIEPRKNQLNLIRAMKLLPEYTLVLIGYKRDIEYANACIEEGGAQLRYLGALPHDSELLRSAYAACSLFALPSTLETPGLAALEAAAAGAKVVVTSEGSTREYFVDAAEYVAHEDYENIARGIKNLLEKDKSLINDNCLNSSFTWTNVSATLAGLYKAVKLGEIGGRYISKFHAIKQNFNEYYAWGQNLVEFDSPAGRLYFIWRSLSGAIVNIYIDGRLAFEKLEVGTAWIEFRLDLLAHTEKEIIHVKIDAGPISEEINSNTRFLGVDIKDLTSVHWTALELDNLIRADIAWNKSSNSSLEEAGPIKLDAKNKALISNFYPIENDGNNFFAWGKYHIEFEWPKGRLCFWWRSANGASVQISVNGISIPNPIMVEKEWSEFTLTLAAENSDSETIHVQMDVTPTILPANGDSRELGFALRDVIFFRETSLDKILLASSMWNKSDLILNTETRSIYENENNEKNLTGFYPIEKNENGFFVWSKSHVEFDWPAGHLSFWWHSASLASVRIRLNGVSIPNPIMVGTEWSEFTLTLAAESTESEKVHVEIDVTPEIPTTSGDSRKLGLAIRDVVFFRETTLDKILLASSIWNKSALISDMETRSIHENDNDEKTATGFYPIEKNGNDFFVWSKSHVKFDWPAGHLSFWWHSASLASVRIRLNGVLIPNPIIVGTEWSEFTLTLAAESTEAEKVHVEIDVTSEILTASDDSRKLGLAIRDVVFLRETTLDRILLASAVWNKSAPLMQKGVQSISENKDDDKNSSGFFPIERNGNNFFAWSKYRIEFDWPVGHLCFWWHSVDDATVRIQVNGKQHLDVIKVGKEWTELTLPLFADDIYSNSVHLQMDVIYVMPIVHGDTRQLGVVIRDAAFRPKTELDRILIASSICNESNIQISETASLEQSAVIEKKLFFGFYPIEKDESDFFAWSKYHVQFDWPAGDLSFYWRSASGAAIYIFLDGELVFDGIEVGSDWTEFILNLPVKKALPGTIHIQINVTPAIPIVNGDARYLGVAIKAVRFAPSSLPFASLASNFN